MKDCATLREWWSEAYDGRLDDRRRDALERHWAACGVCHRQYAAYRRDLEGLGSFLRRAAGSSEAADARPWAPPASRPFAVRAWLATAAAAAAVAGLWVNGPTVAPVSWSESARVADVTPSPECRWRDALPTELERSISYPVIAEDCLDFNFQLVSASVRREEEPCPESVRLTYHAMGRQLVLEQRRETDLPCCDGDHILLGEVVGCVEERGRSLRWQQNRQEFRLSGDAGLGEVVRIAGKLSQSYSALQ